jgi:hypothetical protein
MSGDPFSSYQLLSQVTEGSIRSFHAMAKTGAVVMVHLVDRGDPTEAQDVLRLLEGLPPGERRKVLEIVDREDVLGVVTKFFMEFETLRHWLEQNSTGASAPPRQSVSAPPAEAPGEFTRAFPARAAPAPPDSRGEEPANTPAADPGVRLPVEEPDEFTGAFMPHSTRADLHPTSPQGSPPSPDAATADGSRVPAEPHAAAEEPGEFTRAFLAQSVPPEPTDRDRGGKSEGDPGEIGREFYGDPARPRPASANLNEVTGEPPQAVEPPGESEPGEFTRMFRAAQPPPAEAATRQSAPEAPVPPSASMFTDRPPTPPESGHGTPGTSAGPREAGEFTQLFRARSAAEPAAEADPARAEESEAEPRVHATQQPSSGDSASLEPGEFTRLFRAASAQARFEEGGDSAASDRNGVADGLTGPADPLPQHPRSDGETPARPVTRSEENSSANETRSVADPSPGGAWTAPGEFTGIFGKPVLPSDLPARPEEPSTSSTEQGVAVPPPASNPYRPATADDYLSRLSSADAGHIPPPLPPPPADPSPRAAAPDLPPWLGGATEANKPTVAGPTGPSDYTRIISAQRVPPPTPPPAAAPPSPPAPVAAQPPSPQATPVVLILSLVAVMIAVAALILYFALRPDTPPVPVESEAAEATVAWIKPFLHRWLGA